MELTFSPSNPNCEYIDTFEGLKKAIIEIEKHKIISLDTEGTSLDYYYNKLIFLQIGIPDKAYIFDALKIKDFSPLKNVIEDKSVLKILQNGKFDFGVLKVALNFEITNIFDTMIAEKVLTNGFKQSASLGAMALKYLEVKLEKGFEQYNWDNVALTGKVLKKHLVYAALDVLVLFPIFKLQMEALQKLDLLKVAKLEFAVLPVVAEMELTGNYIDVNKWKELISSLKSKRSLVAENLQNEIRPLYKISQMDLFGNNVDVINLNSQVQLLELFNDKLGLNVPSTGVGVLKTINHPIAKMMLDYRQYEKLISAFGDNLLSKINTKTGRLHPDYMQMGADTGRFACSNPNLQQIPRGSDFRSCFVAAPGKKLVVVDYSQQELRILAEYSGDTVLINAYKDGKDLHTVTASMMYSIPEDKVRKEVERQAAKTINFGLMYGRGAKALSIQLGISEDEAKRLLKLYFEKFSKVKNWLDLVAKEAVTKGYSTTLTGRKRFYQMPDKGDPIYDKIISNIERKGKNTPIQGSGADMVKYALIFIKQRIVKEKLPARIMHTVHDEIVLEADEEAAEEVLKVQKEEMLRAGSLLLKKVPVDASGEISNVWEH